MVDNPTPDQSLSHHPVSRLPLPVHSAKLLAFLDQSCPDSVEHPTLDSPLESPMHGRVIAELLGHPVALATRPDSEGDGMQHGSPISAGASGSLWGTVSGDARSALIDTVLVERRATNGDGGPLRHCDTLSSL
jgi:hypothetical protein